MPLEIHLYINATDYDITEYLIKDSLNISYSLFNKDLEPTTNKAIFSISGKTYITDLLLNNYDADIGIEILDGATYLFKGFITNNYNLKLLNTGLDNITISAEDTGIKYLKKNWISSNGLFTFINEKRLSKPTDRANSAIHIIATLAGIPVSSTIPTIDTRLTLNIQDSDNKTYWDILKQVCFEFGYVFFITPAGELNLFKIAKNLVVPSITFSPSTNLIIENIKEGFELRKSIVAYKQVNIKFDEWETKSNLYVFRDTTGGTSLYDCLIPLAPGAYYPEGADASTFVFPNYKLETGQEIVNVNSASADYQVDAGITVEFENLGVKGKLRIQNTSATTAYIRKLRIKATSVICKKNFNTIKSGDNVPPKLEYTAKYIHNYSNVNELANTLKEYYKYSNYSYSFKSKTIVELGTIAQLNDTTWNTINEPILITKKSIRENGIINYEAIGIDVFNISATTTRDIILYGNQNTSIVRNPQMENSGITIGSTAIKLGDTVGSVNGVTITGSEYNFDKQKVYARLIPGSDYQILTQQNKGTLLSDVFTIYELLAPYTYVTETTYAFHNVVNGTDDWVRDLSFHNYSTRMKAVDVISHFTGTQAGIWQWVSRYSTGTDYDMIERYIMTLEGDTGNLKLGEDNSITSNTRGKLDIRNSGISSVPSLFISADSENGSMVVQNGNNFSMAGNVATFKLLNSSDTGTILNLNHAGSSGFYLKADNKLTISVDGSIEQLGNNGLKNTFVSGNLGTGWKLDYNTTIANKSYLEIDNILVRDSLRTHIFEKNTIKATNGQLYISDSGIIADDYNGDGTISFDIDKSATFNQFDKLIIKDWNTSSGTIREISFQITAVGTAANGKQPYTIATIAGSRSWIQKGMTAVRYNGGNILIDASSTNSPFIDVISNYTTKARYGRLDGINSPTFGQLSGYGLWSDNAYLEGSIKANSGQIGSFNIGTYLNTNSKATYNDNLTGVHIGSDGIGLGSNFKVDNSGNLTVSSGTISGSVIKTSDNRARLTAAFATQDSDGLNISIGDLDNPSTNDTRILLGKTRTTVPGLKSYIYSSGAWKWMNEFVTFVDNGYIHSDWQVTSDGTENGKSILALIQDTNRFSTVLFNFNALTPSGTADNTDLGESARKFRNLYLAGQMDCYVIDDDSTPLATKSGTTTFTVYKPISCILSTDESYDASIELKYNGSYYILGRVPAYGTNAMAVTLNPGNYRLNGSLAVLRCVGVYGSASATGIWS